MKRFLYTLLGRTAVVFCLLGTSAAQGPNDVIAVLSSNSKPYQEALAGFQESYGHVIPVQIMTDHNPELSDSTRIVVTFGGKAALYPYPDGTTLIYALTPGLVILPEQHRGRSIKVLISPPPDILISKLLEIQPNLKRLAVFWVSPTFNQNVKDLQILAESHGILLRKEFLSTPEDFPKRLRTLKGSADAFWMYPDPALMTPTVFAAAKEFGFSNDLPFYAPIDSLADKGAAASISTSFNEMGRTAGRLALKAIAGNLEDIASVYSEKIVTTLNLTVAAQSGLSLSPAVIKKSDRVVP